MKPDLLIRRPLAFAAATPALIRPIQTRHDRATPSLTKRAFQLRSQGMLDYLVDTLRKTW
jgi:hypothetical protein